jgi:hypothetical protein
VGLFCDLLLSPVVCKSLFRVFSPSAIWNGKTTVAPAAGASLGEMMKYRLQTAAGKAKYKSRQQAVEPVFGIIKSVFDSGSFFCSGKKKWDPST